MIYEAIKKAKAEIDSAFAFLYIGIVLVTTLYPYCHELLR